MEVDDLDLLRVRGADLGKVNGEDDLRQSAPRVIADDQDRQIARQDKLRRLVGPGAVETKCRRGRSGPSST